MEIIKTLNGDELILQVKGELNVTNSKELEDVVSDSLGGIKKLVFDFTELEYISSAGLRVILKVCKYLNGVGEVSVINASESIRSVLEMTGFTKVMKVETR